MRKGDYKGPLINCISTVAPVPWTMNGPTLYYNTKDGFMAFPETRTITMTEDEALAFAAVSCHIGGDHKTTRRGAIDKLSKKVKKEFDLADIEINKICDFEIDDSCRRYSGITFTEKPYYGPERRSCRSDRRTSCGRRYLCRSGNRASMSSRRKFTNRRKLFNNCQQ